MIRIFLLTAVVMSSVLGLQVCDQNTNNANVNNLANVNSNMAANGNTSTTNAGGTGGGTRPGGR